MSNVTFHWEPDPALLGASMDAVAASLYERVIPLEAASEAMRADIMERFTTETDPEGNPWKELSDSYVYGSWFNKTPPPFNMRRKSGTTLKDTGELMKAATSSQATVVTNDTVFYQTSALPSFGLAHESGLPEREHPLPQRAFLGLSAQSVTVIFGFFTEWFDESIKLFPTKTGKLGRRHAFRAAPGGFFIKT